MLLPEPQPTHPPRSTVHLPRLLLLHGGGTNAPIFHQQTRSLRALLTPHFRLVYASAPFPCAAPGPDVAAVYNPTQYGPYRRWLRWLEAQPAIEGREVVSEIERALEKAMEEDEARGGRGEWVGLVGFSQGAAVAGSLLLRQQGRGGKGGKGRLGRARFRFGVLMAGSAPLVSLEPERGNVPGLGDAGGLTRIGGVGVGRWGRHVLQVPTVHVHGLRDPGLERHRVLLERYCEEGSARLVEWEGGHKVPIKRSEVAAVVEGILDVAEEVGAVAHHVD